MLSVGQVDSQTISGGELSETLTSLHFYFKNISVFIEIRLWGKQIERKKTVLAYRTGQ